MERREGRREERMKEGGRENRGREKASTHREQKNTRKEEGVFLL